MKLNWVDKRCAEILTICVQSDAGSLVIISKYLLHPVLAWLGRWFGSERANSDRYTSENFCLTATAMTSSQSTGRRLSPWLAFSPFRSVCWKCSQCNVIVSDIWWCVYLHEVTNMQPICTVVGDFAGPFYALPGSSPDWLYWGRQVGR